MCSGSRGEKKEYEEKKEDSVRRTEQSPEK